MEKQENNYGKEYYKSGCGMEYERGNGWEEIFSGFAERIVREINPKKVLDAGCAKGFLVEALCDKGVDAYGIDSSEYAISCARDDMKDRCKVQSILEPIQEKYDLITCIEVLEHLSAEDIPVAIQRLCEAADDIIFSSTPFDYDEETHISVRSVDYWAEQFAYHGFYHDVQYDCSYLAVQAMRFRKVEKTKAELIRDYEKQLFLYHQENVAVRHNYQIEKEQIQIYKDAYQKHVDMINEELNPKIQKLQLELNEYKKQADKAEDIIIRCEQKCKEEVDKRKICEEEARERQDYERLAVKLQYDLDSIKIQSILDEVGCNKPIVLRMSLKSKLKEKKYLKFPYEFWEPVFDAEWYAGKYADLKNVFGEDKESLLRHFIMHGMAECREGNERFNVVRYMMNNADLVKAFGKDVREYYVHYCMYGKDENRLC